MINTRIYKVLTSLEKPMLNRFSKFIHSPYHNVNDKISGLVDLMIDAIKSEVELPSKKDIWKRLKIKGEYEDVKFRKLCNDTLERFESFLIYERLEDKSILKQNLLIENIYNTRLQELIEKNVVKSKRLIDRAIDKSSDFYLQRYLYEKNIQNITSQTQDKKSISKHLSNNEIEKLSEYLDVFYAIEKLRIASDSIGLKMIYETHSEEIDLKSTLEIINQLDQKEKYPALNIYLNMYNIVANINDTESYNKLKRYTFDNHSIFPNLEKKEILDALFSFCIEQINLSKDEFLLELLDMYDRAIELELILINGKLSSTVFRNYVVSGLRAREFNRIEKFILTKSVLLDNEKRENEVNFNLARLNFHKKHFENALEYLSKVNYDDIWHQLNSRVQLLAVYYELDELDALMTSIESFRTFLRREKAVLKLRTKRYLNFTRYLKGMVTNSIKKDRIKKLKEELASEKNVVNKSWLLEKIDELL